MGNADLDEFDATREWAGRKNIPGSEKHCRSEDDLHRLERMGRAWRLILRTTGLRPPARTFEAGCGHGDQLATLALNGFDAHGIDVADVVLNGAENFLREIDRFRLIKFEVGVGDVFDYKSEAQYDLTYHFGVVEHFQKQEQRDKFWKKLVELTKPNGWVVSVVPCGQHPMRARVRKEKLAGYDVREIDYSGRLHVEEFERAGLRSIRIVPFNYFWFLAAHPSRLISKFLYPILYLPGNAILPVLPMPLHLKDRLAHTLIAFGRKS